MTVLGKALVVGALTCAVVGFRAYVVRYGLPFAETQPDPRATTTTIAHMDHAPRHGGLVLMNGDTHFEVILDADGNCQVYFSDAVRTELPATFASEVSVGLASLNRPRQNISLQTDPVGKSWIGRLSMARDPQAIVRITYVAGGAPPYWIDVPLSAVQTVPKLFDVVAR